MKTKKILLLVASALLVVSCGNGGGGRPTFGDNEYPVVTVGTQNSASQVTYPASIKGVQDVQHEGLAEVFHSQIQDS